MYLYNFIKTIETNRILKIHIYNKIAYKNNLKINYFREDYLKHKKNYY